MSKVEKNDEGNKTNATACVFRKISELCLNAINETKSCSALVIERSEEIGSTDNK